MSSSDDTDSDSSFESSDDADVESSHSESEESDSNHNDNRLPDADGGNRVSETVFLEGTESAANVIFFAASSIAAPIAHPVNTNMPINRPTTRNTGSSTAFSTSIARPADSNRTTYRRIIARTNSSATGSTSIARPTNTDRTPYRPIVTNTYRASTTQTIETNRLTAQGPRSSVAGASFTSTVNINKPTVQIPRTGSNTNGVNIVSNNIAPKERANISPTQPKASAQLASRSIVKTATSQTNQTLDAVQALEERVARDTCCDHLSMPWYNQNYGTTPHTATQPVSRSTNTSIFGYFGEFLQYIFFQPQIYTPLPSPSHIRVLAIQPSVNDDILVASFEILDLNATNFRFEAISYQWGEGGGLKAPVRLGGEKISINEYLRSILLHLRLKRHVRIVWADALCINQADHAERLQQVSIMQRIYSEAFRVIGFVGKDYMHADKCFYAVKALTSAWFNAQKRLGDEDSSSFTSSNIYGRVRNEASMCRIVEIFQSGYWKRLWVVQELASSRRAVIQWGDAEISWTLLGLATTLIRNNQDLMILFNRVEKSKKSPGPFQGRTDARTGLMNAYLMYRMPSAEFRSSSMSFLDVLRLTRKFDVSERLDRIYAILGLPSQHTGPGSKSVPPDYRLLPNGLYSRVFYWVFHTHENPLEILSAVRHTTLLYPDYPTWIPQWHVEPIRSIGGSHRAGMKFDASAGWKPKPPAKLVWNSNKRHLILQGFILGSVTSSHRVFPETNKNSQARDKKLVAHNAKLSGWLSENVNNHKSISGQLPLVLTAGQDWYGNILKEQTAVSRHSESFERWKPKYFQNRAHYDQDAIRYGQAVGNVCDERKLFNTTRSLLGLGPNLVRKGDVVCVVAGGPVPYILRPLGDDTFYFVGECYVAGYMFGEVVMDWRSRASASLSLRQFVLR